METALKVPKTARGKDKRTHLNNLERDRSKDSYSFHWYQDRSDRQEEQKHRGDRISTYGGRDRDYRSKDERDYRRKAYGGSYRDRAEVADGTELLISK
ncbi:hypothetical protein ACH5RR_024594 [Cinchona calisaya]|uniref:Uncharacterized protein n=1 Tax=Cinchona calisaya TaxID=153742 RepID=A0ABD2Z195_9GENT